MPYSGWTGHWFFLGSGGVVPDQPPPLATQDVTRRRFPHSHSGIFKTYFTYHLILFILVYSKAPIPHPSQLPQACQVLLPKKKLGASSSWYIVSIGQKMVIINLLYWKRHWTSIFWKSGIWCCWNEDQGEGRRIRRKWRGPIDRRSCLSRMECVAVCMLPKYLLLGEVKKENQLVNCFRIWLR